MPGQINISLGYYWQEKSLSLAKLHYYQKIAKAGDTMQSYLGDIGVVFAAGLVLMYMMWDKLFHD